MFEEKHTQIHSIEVTQVVAQSNSQGALKLYSKTRRVNSATRPKNENENVLCLP